MRCNAGVMNRSRNLKRKQESKKERKHTFGQESDQVKDRNDNGQEKNEKRKRKNALD